jgi:hypothetical protein
MFMGALATATYRLLVYSSYLERDNSNCHVRPATKKKTLKKGVLVYVFLFMALGGAPVYVLFRKGLIAAVLVAS